MNKGLFILVLVVIGCVLALAQPSLPTVYGPFQKPKSEPVRKPSAYQPKFGGAEYDVYSFEWWCDQVANRTRIFYSTNLVEWTEHSFTDSYLGWNRGEIIMPSLPKMLFVKVVGDEDLAYPVRQYVF